ncbi:MAG: glycosyltransferase, partial [Christensenellales bacterium]
SFTSIELVDFSLKQHWEFLDQDVLNHFCQNRVKLIDMSWDAMMNNAGISLDIAIKAPESIYNEYLKARENPKIIHYAGWEKPWNIPSLDMAEYFWKYARLSPYYEDILVAMNKYQCNNLVKKEYIYKEQEKPLSNIQLFKKICKTDGFFTAVKRSIKTLCGISNTAKQKKNKKGK